MNYSEIIYIFVFFQIIISNIKNIKTSLLIKFKKPTHHRQTTNTCARSDVNIQKNIITK